MADNKPLKLSIEPQAAAEAPLGNAAEPRPATGALLIEARTRKGMTVAEAAAALRIRQTYLEAIEQGRLGDLPGATYALGFAIAMLVRRRRAELMATAVALGGVAGLIRMGEGGHFMSDVVFAGVFKALDVALMYWLVFNVLAHRTRDEAWWHEKTLALTGELSRKSAQTVAGGRYWLSEKFPATLGANFATKDRPESDD